MLVPAIPSPRPPSAEHGALGDRASDAERLFRYYRLHRPVPRNPEDVQTLAESLVAAWKADADGPQPQLGRVCEMADAFDETLLDVWTRYSEGPLPAISLGATLDAANPFVVTAPHSLPLVVLPNEIWLLVFGFIVTVYNYDDRLLCAKEAARCLDALLLQWLTNDHRYGPVDEALVAMTTSSRRNAEIAAGVGYAVLSWALYHEIGHLRLGHLPAGTARLYLEPHGDATAQVRTFSHDNELAADRFGLEQLICLMENEAEIRKRIQFGKGADHAPIIFFELADLAYRRWPELDRRRSASHPPPLSRGRQLLDRFGASLSTDGRFFYCEHWREILAMVAKDLPRNLP